MDLNELTLLVEQQKQYFQTGITLPVVNRKHALQKLRSIIQVHESEILNALSTDLGKHQSEAYMAEIGMVYSEISFMLKNLNQLARAKTVKTPLYEIGSSSQVIPVPYGSVLIMSPWNYPFLLTMQPLIVALAAGNCAVVKPSAYSASVSAVIEQIILEAFDTKYVMCIQGGRQENQALLDMDFDYIFFTGSVNVGKEVMAKASVHLTPVTLELGGKSPCIVDETANIALAARRIVFGKYLNAGQTCVAPDYVIVHKSVHDAFIAQVKHQIKKQYPAMSAIGKIINAKHFNRLNGLIEKEKVVCGGQSDLQTLQIAPTILDNVDWNDPVMQEEIFGPIMPVLVYERFEDLTKMIRSRPTPLATYLFSKNQAHIDYIKYNQPFGSGCINDTIMQLANDSLPFGGMGQSGMGQYHGRYGFETFSHAKGMLTNNLPMDMPLRYSPYSKAAQAVLRLFLK